MHVQTSFHEKNTARSPAECESSRDLRSQLADAWRAYAKNRPAYEAACEALSTKFAATIVARRLPLFVGGNCAPEASKAAEALEVEVGLEGAGSTGEIDEQTATVVYDVIQKIWRKVPTNLTDLANLANAVATIHYEAWESEPNKLDYDVQALRLLVEGVLRVAGQDLIIGGLPGSSNRCHSMAGRG